MNRKTPVKNQYLPGQVLPHQGSMLLIDSIVDWDQDWIKTRVRRTNTRLFDLGPSMDSGVAALEYLGQSAGAHAGIRQLEQNKPIIIGFIIGSRAFRVDQAAFLAHDEFEVHVDQTFRDTAGIGLYATRMYAPEHPDHTIAEAVIKAVMPDDPSAVFRQTMLRPRSVS